MQASQRSRIEGHVSAGFEAVREAFAENFARRHELGGACCVYHRGEKVVDLWGGVRNKATGEPWEEDTMVLVYSATKGLAAMTLARRAFARLARLRRARLHVLAGVRAAGQGDASPSGSSWLTRRACSPSMSRWTGAWSPTSIAWRSSWLARNRPGSPARGRPITRSPSASTKASCCAAIDPQHRSLGQFFQDEIASPLGLDFYIRLPESIPNSRLATLAPPSPSRCCWAFRSDSRSPR